VDHLIVFVPAVMHCAIVAKDENKELGAVLNL
jgi:hypothetical protein